jgi:hypothetical protein
VAVLSEQSQLPFARQPETNRDADGAGPHSHYRS